MKEKIKNEYLRRKRKLLEIKIQSRDLIKGINKHLGCPPRKILGTILIVDEKKNFNKRTREQENS